MIINKEQESPTDSDKRKNITPIKPQNCRKKHQYCSHCATLSVDSLPFYIWLCLLRPASKTEMIDVKNNRLSSKAYLDFIRSKPCIGCGKGPTDAHHVKARGMGGGHENDFTAAPLCRECHNGYHRIGLADFERNHKVNVWRECFYLLLEYSWEKIK